MSTKKSKSPAKKPKLDPGLLAAHKAYEAAINTNDTDLVMAMYDKDAAQMPPDAPETVGWKQLRQAVASYFKEYKTTWKKVVKSNWVSGEWGFDEGHDTAVDIPRSGHGDTIHWNCKGILVYKRQPTGEWKVFRDIWNNITPPVTTPTKPSKGGGTPAPKKGPAKAQAGKAATKEKKPAAATKKPAAAKKPAAKPAQAKAKPAKAR